MVILYCWYWWTYWPSLSYFSFRYCSIQSNLY